jgi:hypothetical protein
MHLVFFLRDNWINVGKWNVHEERFTRDENPVAVVFRWCVLCVYREYCLGTCGVSLQWFDLKRDQPAFLEFCRNRHRR